MATIRDRDGRYMCLIRSKGIEIGKTFSSKQDAELWAKYKEDLIDQIDAFDPPLKEMITLQDAIEMRIEIQIKNEVSKKDISDYKTLIKVFEKFCPKKMSDIKYNDLVDHFNFLLTHPVTRGGTGKNDGTGHTRLPSFMTIFRKYAYLSTVYQMLIKDGVDIENIALKVVQYMRHKAKKE